MRMNIQNEDSGIFLDSEVSSKKRKRSLLERYKREFSEAEQAIKKGELSFKKSSSSRYLVEYRGLFIPAINELRYAGKHMGDFVLSKNFDELLEAIFHCVRAKNDAYDCLIQYRLYEVRSFMEQYSSIIISEVIEDYDKKLQQINDVIERSGMKPQKDEEGEVSSRLEKVKKSVDDRTRDCEILGEICETFNLSRDKLNIKLQKENTRRYCRSLVLLFSVTLLCVLAILSILPF